MYNLLELGAKIVISMEKCLSTVFWIENSVLHCYNKELGECVRTDMNAEKFNNHVQRIISEGGKIDVHTYTNKQAEIYNSMDDINALENRILGY